jgi:hypothetical protein
VLCDFGTPAGMVLVASGGGVGSLLRPLHSSRYQSAAGNDTWLGQNVKSLENGVFRLATGMMGLGEPVETLQRR